VKRLAEETGVSKSSTRSATQLLKHRPCTSYNNNNLRLAATQFGCQGLILQSFLQFVFKDEIDPQMTLFSDEAWFHLQANIKM
jgi:hypothetical protein